MLDDEDGDSRDVGGHDHTNGQENVDGVSLGRTATSASMAMSPSPAE